MDDRFVNIPPKMPASDAADAKQANTPQTAEQWAEQEHTEAWLLASATRLHNWPIGKTLTRDDYRKAIDATRNLQLGSDRKDDAAAQAQQTASPEKK